MLQSLLAIRKLLSPSRAARVAIVALVAAFPGLCFGAATPLTAQTATVTTEENFRAEPNGTLLGRIRPGTILGVVEAEGQWVRATLSGWIWNPSLEATDREGFDLLVSAEGGENLRVEPQGTILARLEEGTLLEELEEGDSWTRVRRTAWIWRPSVSVDDDTTPAAEPVSEEAGADDGLRTVGSDGLAILSVPDGDTLARSTSGSPVRILGRQGSWARVQLEGWAWMPDAEPGGAPADTAVLTNVGPDEVAANPDRYRGRVVSWQVQFISQEEAEPVRTDFYEGEPYLLTRSTGGSARFVYVAVPPEHMADIDALMPLESIRVVGRIRTGSAALTGGPILDLLDLSRGDSSGGAGDGG